MSDVIIFDRMQQRRGTTSDLASVNEVLREGEICVELGTGKFKLGDGTTAWNSLEYVNLGAVDFTGMADGYVPAWDATDSVFKMVAQTSGTSGDPSLKTVARFYDECYMASVATGGWTTDLVSGTVSVQQAVTGMSGAYVLVSGGSSGNRAAIAAGGFKVALGSKEIRCRFRVKPEHLPSGSQQSHYNIGLSDNIAPTSATYRISLVAQDSNPTGNWYLSYIHPSGNAVSTTGITLTAGAIHDLDMVINAAGTTVSAYLAGVLKDTFALPASFNPMHPFAWSRKSGATGITTQLWIDKVFIEQDQ